MNKYEKERVAHALYIITVDRGMFADLSHSEKVETACAVVELSMRLEPGDPKISAFAKIVVAMHEHLEAPNPADMSIETRVTILESRVNALIHHALDQSATSIHEIVEAHNGTPVKMYISGAQKAMSEQEKRAAIVKAVHELVRAEINADCSERTRGGGIVAVTARVNANRANNAFNAACDAVFGVAE